MRPAFRTASQYGAAIMVGLAVVVAASVGTQTQGTNATTLTGATIVATLKT